MATLTVTAVRTNGDGTEFLLDVEVEGDYQGSSPDIAERPDFTTQAYANVSKVTGLNYYAFNPDTGAITLQTSTSLTTDGMLYDWLFEPLTGDEGRVTFTASIHLLLGSTSKQVALGNALSGTFSY